MLVTLIPLFDENMTVSAYSLFSQKKNYFLNPSLLGTGQNDGASTVDGFEVIQSMGVETISEEQLIFVPVGNVALFGDINEQCGVPHKRIVLLIDHSVLPEDMYIKRLGELKKDGYNLAIRKLEIAQFEPYRQILNLMDYIFLDYKKIKIDMARIYFGKLFPKIKLCAGNIEDMGSFEGLKKTGGYQYYEGKFFRVAINRGEHQVSPIKVNYIQLLNMMNSPDFELTHAADVIGRDTALVISLLKMVNKLSINSKITSIRHAAAMLGERELKKWLTTAVASELYTDKPNELTRVSLLRAKFAENLAPSFGLAAQSAELFLMGLFSILDVILEVPMEEALDMVKVSKNISDALVEHKGKFELIYEFILQYESANWQEVSRLMVIHSITMQPLYESYLKALKWYRDMVTEN